MPTATITQPTAAAGNPRPARCCCRRCAAPTNPVLLSDLGPVMPVVVYTGPTRAPSQLATLSSDIAAEPDKKKTKHHKATAARVQRRSAGDPRSRQTRSPSSPSRPMPSRRAKPADDAKPTAAQAHRAPPRRSARRQRRRSRPSRNRRRAPAHRPLVIPGPSVSEEPGIHDPCGSTAARTVKNLHA